MARRSRHGQILGPLRLLRSSVRHRRRFEPMRSILLCRWFGSREGRGGLGFRVLAIDRNYTLIFVVRKWSLRAGRVIAAHIGGTNAPNILWGFWSDRFDCAYVEGWMVPDVVVTATTAWKLYTGDSSATGTARLYSNGQLLRSHPTPPPSKGLSSTLNISGHDDTSTEDADCEVAELVLYNRVLPEPERMVVEDYMRVKWNPL